MTDREHYYVPSYVNRFTKLGSVFRMWFKPLQELVGDIVNYEDEEDHGPINDSEEEPDSYNYEPHHILGTSNIAPKVPLLPTTDLEECILRVDQQKLSTPDKEAAGVLS